ncbi:DUF6157 family protein [Caldibacillus lycopersici]|uniref:DUF6157 family protein n=1 Tax=Perspicuibacillus lycopersici TaxID=1325689 RepID=A0AAE3IUS0_9BACI|nr:DUF6157 family protein [Perspicuibacillus lycopersici]MCU9614582.1 DUF6157 family protein [Perspicuibacillus lycopersici]
MSYKNTFITISEDSPRNTAVIPVPKNEKPTIASIEFELIKNNPYHYTQADVQFQTYVRKNKLETENLAELKDQFFSKPKACFRASPLVKSYGWGIHYDNEGKIALYAVNSEEYLALEKEAHIQKLKGMRTKRK